MKKLLFILLLFSQFASGQTNLSFTQVPFTNPEIIGPNRGAENWNGLHQINIPSSNSPDNSVDYYYRFKWTEIQDYTTGNFIYTTLDSKVHAAIDRGSRFNFGIMGHYPGQGVQVDGSFLGYPLPVHNAMQAEPVFKDWADTRSDFPGYDSWTPNWNAPSFRAAYNKMIDSVVYHLKHTTYKGWNEWDVVGYVEIRTFGATGEWTAYNLTTNKGGPTNSIATAATQEQFIDDFVARVPDKQLLICVAAAEGSQLADGQPNEVAYKVFTTSNSFGRIGLRRDCLGETASYVHEWFENNDQVYNGIKFDSAFMNFYKVAPWGGEPCSCCTINGGPIQYWDLPRQIVFYHNGFFGNGNIENNTNSRVGDSIRAASKVSGYRLVLTGGSMTTTLTTGSSFNITLKWKNTGITPAYEKWNVVYELRTSGGAVAWTSQSAFTPRLFLPSSSDSSASDDFTLPSISAGTYSLYMLVKDPSGYRKPLPLAITGQNSDGSYLLRSNITVVTSIKNYFIINPGHKLFFK